MNKQLASIIWIDASIAFFIPFGSTLVAALTPFTSGALPSKIALAVMTIGAGIAGCSGLKSFLSTTLSDAKDDIASQAKPISWDKPADKNKTEQT